MAQYVPSPGKPRNVARVYASGPAWVEITPVPEAVAHTRRMVRGWLASSHPEFIYNAELVTSELVTNAIKCVRASEAPRAGIAPAIWFHIETQVRWIHLRIRDPYPGTLPMKKDPDLTETSGRGVLISETIADYLWVEVSSVDKVVHAVLVKPGVTLTEAEISRLGG